MFTKINKEALILSIMLVSLLSGFGLFQNSVSAQKVNSESKFNVILYISQNLTGEQSDILRK